MAAEQLSQSPESIQGERFGTEGMFRLTRFVLPIETDTVGVVDYSVHVIRRENNPHLGTEKPQGEPKQVVLLSGFDTGGQDWLRMAEQLMLDMPDVEQLTLLDHPSSSGVHHERTDVALNTTSFENSAKVISEAMERLLETGEIKKGQIAIGLSTGCAVLEEVAALNPKLIDTLILCAPAGNLNRTPDQMVKGGSSGGGPYFLQFFDDLFKRVAKKDLQSKADGAKVEPIGIVKSIPHTAHERIPEESLKGIRVGNFIFETIFKVMRKIPRWYQHFTGTWGDADPHVPIVKADYRQDMRLVARDTTESARAAIHDKKIVVVMGMDDKAVPPKEFLTPSDNVEIDQIANPNKKAETTLERIIARTKELFPNNENTKVVLAVGGPGDHVGLKVYTELFGPIIANILQPIKPEKTWTLESGWQKP